jgi:hypothetical protein
MTATAVKYEKLKPSVKKKWVAALRSGDYRQGQGTLAARDRWSFRGKGDKFCCLGVLCDIAPDRLGSWEAGPQGKAELDEWYGNINVEFVPAGSECGRDDSPPSSVREWAGLDDKAETILMSMNDGGSLYEGDQRLDFKRKSFRKIADWIEENL